jgi:hypothetical protein
MFRTYRSLLIALSLIALGCSDGLIVTDSLEELEPSERDFENIGVVVESPLEGAVITEATVEVIGEAVEHDSLTINDQEVSVIDGRFSHTLSLPSEGPVQITVSAGGAHLIRHVTVDRSGPTLTINAPVRGLVMDRAEGTSIIVQGAVMDPAGVTRLEVNGQPITPDAGGQFSASVSATVGVNLIRIDAEDSAGRTTSDVRAVISGELRPFHEPVDDGITLRLERDALRLAGEALGAQITPDLFGNLGGAVQQGDFQVLGVTMGDAEVDLVPGDGVLDIELKVYDLQLDFAANFNGSNVRGDINAHPAIIRLGLRMETDGIGGLDLHIVSAEAEFEDFDFDVNGLLGLFDWIIRGVVRGKLEEGLADALTGKIVADILQADALNQVGELLGYPAAYALSLTHIGVDPGGIDVALDAGVEITRDAAHQMPGYFANPKTAPLGGDGGMVRFSLADDFLNMLLAQVWQVGGLRVDLGALLDNAEEGAIPLQLNAGSVSALLRVPELLDHTAPDAKVGLILEMGAAPIVQAFGGAQKKVQIDAPEMQLTFSYDDNGVRVVWAVVVVHLGVGLTRDAEGVLQFDIQSVIDVVDAPIFPLIDEEMSGALSGLFGLLPSLVAGGGEGGLLGGLGQLGDLGSVNPGVAVEDFQMRVGGDNGGYLDFGLELIVQLVPLEAPDLAIIQTEISPINGRTYHLLEVSNWSDAEAFARSLGGHLATIRSRDEDRWILRTFGEKDRQNRDLWIGLHDASREGQWEWTSGEPVDYQNFDRKQPDNGIDEETGSLNEDYVHIYGDRSPRRDGKWNDAKNVDRTDYNDGFHGVVEVFEPVVGESP